MRQIAFKSSFRKDLKRMLKRGVTPSKLQTVIEDLRNDVPLPTKYRPHQLSGEWRGFMECHIEPDWLLIYDQSSDNTLTLHRTGTHSDLFE
jgi:mRNA interferase YafQ